MDIMSNKTGKMQSLYDLNSACLQDIAAGQLIPLT